MRKIKKWTTSESSGFDYNPYLLVLGTSYVDFEQVPGWVPARIVVLDQHLLQLPEERHPWKEEREMSVENSIKRRHAHLNTYLYVKVSMVPLSKASLGATMRVTSLSPLSPIN